MDVSTTYVGLPLKNPLVHSASPLSQTLDGIRRLEDAGVAAVVMHSLFEEQINEESHQLDHYLSYGEGSQAEAFSYFPDLDHYHVGPDEYLSGIAAAKRAVDIPIIGSLNGVSAGGWTEYARRIEEAGADALELNVYFIPADIRMTGHEVEDMYVDVVTSVKRSVSIPVAVKVGPFFSSFGHVATRLAAAGADALVLFNRFFQPDFDLDTLSVVPRLRLSHPDEFRLPLRWIAILYGRVDVDFALTTGVRSPDAVVRALMAGANAVMVTSELLERGVGRAAELLAGMTEWLTEHEYESVTQIRGSMSQRHCAEPAAFERANYMKALQSWRPDPTGRALD